uniref:nodal homolog n=1 Tax=Myxine glutinosa TaxID=7769 RepID=UPI00358FDB5C
MDTETGRPHEYMMRLYRGLEASAGLRELRGDAMDLADTVRSVRAQECKQRASQWRISFDLSGIPTNEHLTFAELRIRIPAFSSSRRAFIHLRAVSTLGVNPQAFGYLRASPSRDAPGLNAWRIYNVTDAVARRLSGNNIGLRWRTKQRSRRQRAQNSRRSGRWIRHLMMQHVFLVLYSHSVRPLRPSVPPSLLHAATLSKYVMDEAVYPLSQSRNRRHGWTTAETSLCRRVDLHIDFQRLGWGDFVVYPMRFNAFRCEGECPSPVDHRYKPTNHAYMQSLLRRFEHGRVPAPCCSPIRHSSRNLLYREAGAVQLRTLTDVVVEECGCR